jgi:hypothetical protein
MQKENRFGSKKHELRLGTQSLLEKQSTIGMLSSEYARRWYLQQWMRVRR